MSKHLTSLELSELLDEEGDLEEFVPRVLHLVTCAICRDVFSEHRKNDLSLLALRVFGQPELPPLPRRRDANARWRGLLDRCLPKVDRALEERRGADRLWEEARPWPAARRHLEIINRRRFHTLGFVHRIVREVEMLQRLDPREAESWCDVGLALVDRLPEGRYGARTLHDVRARLFAHRGNCGRVRDDHVAADRDFRKADFYLGKGSGEPLNQARIYSLEASLRRDQQRFDEARELLHWAAEVYRSVRDPERLANVTIQKAMLCHDQGDTDSAIRTLEGLLAEDSASDLAEATLVDLEHNLTVYLTDVGDIDEADRRLTDLRARVARSTRDRFDHTMRLDWLEATIRVQQDRIVEAEGLYEAARDAFLEEGMAYDAALVSLDLAALYLDQGRAEAAAHLAMELSPLLWEGDLHREAVAALMLFQEAAVRHTATARYARDVADTLQKFRGRPVTHSTTH